MGRPSCAYTSVPSDFLAYADDHICIPCIRRAFMNTVPCPHTPVAHLSPG